MRSLLTLAVGSLCLLLTSFAGAQELAPGKYSGSYNPAQVANALVSIVLDIRSVDEGTITGQGELHLTTQHGAKLREGCFGGFPLRGTVKGDAVSSIWAAEKWGPAGECKSLMRGTVSGNKISGKIGQSTIELSR